MGGGNGTTVIQWKTAHHWGSRSWMGQRVESYERLRKTMGKKSEWADVGVRVEVD